MTEKLSCENYVRMNTEKDAIYLNLNICYAFLILLADIMIMLKIQVSKYRE